MKTKAVNIGGNWIHDNGDLPKRVEKDVYLTPAKEAEQAYEFLLQAVPALNNPNLFPFHILDVGSGGGIWGKVARSLWHQATITGTEIRDIPKPCGYDHWEVGDFLKYDTCHTRYDLVVGNPPYYADSDCVKHAMQLLKPGGHLLFLLKLTFITGQKRLETIYQQYGLQAFGVYTHRIRWYSLNGDLGGSPPRDHGLFLWQKGSKERCKVYLIGDEEKGIIEL